MNTQIRGGGISLVKVWTNPNPTQVFPQTTIPYDLTNYDYVIIKYAYYNGDLNNTTISQYKKGQANMAMIYIFDGMTNYARGVSINDTGITIGSNPSPTITMPLEIYVAKKPIV